MATQDSQTPPILTAVSSSARQLFLLLRCISFHPRVQIQILSDGLKFTADEFSYMEAMVYLEKSLFSSWRYNPPTQTTSASQQSRASQDLLGGGDITLDDDTDNNVAPFSISLPSLLETLQIFGITDTRYNSSNSNARDPYSTIFANQAVGITSLCRLTYDTPGAPLEIHLEEGSVRTTCELVTYEPTASADIPFSRDKIALKVIMAGASLLDAITELGGTNPVRLAISASREKGTLTLSSSSDIGSATVEFRNDQHVQQASGINQPAPTVLETFQVSTDDFAQTYTFAHILHAKRAMQSAVKVSIRGDEQGVLSLQFMVENLEGGGVSFVDYRFVPLVEEDRGGEEDEDGDGNRDQNEEG